MAGDEPAPGWTMPGQPPAPPPPYYAAGQPGGWNGPPPPPPYGWVPQGAPQAPRPGVIPLRPLAVGELLDGGFTTIRRYPRATLGLAAAVMVVVETVQLITSYYFLHNVRDSSSLFQSNDSANQAVNDLAARTLTVEGIVLVVTLIATALLSGMLAAVIGEGVLGRPMSAAEAWARARGSFWPLLGATAAVAAVGVGVMAAGIAPGLVIFAAGGGAAGVGVMVLGGLIAVPFAFYLYVGLSFTTPALMLEKQGIRAAMRRSRTLVKHSWWRVFWILLLTGLIAGVMAGVIGAPFAVVGGGGVGFLTGQGHDQFRFFPLLMTGIGGLIGGTLARPFTAAVTTLLYLDRRMRAEALDLTLQQAAAGPR